MERVFLYPRNRFEVDSILNRERRERGNEQ